MQNGFPMIRILRFVQNQSNTAKIKSQCYLPRIHNSTMTNIAIGSFFLTDLLVFDYTFVIKRIVRLFVSETKKSH